MLYKRKLRNTILTHLFVIFVGFVMVYPLLWMVSSSFKPSSEIFAASSFFPQESHADLPTTTDCPRGRRQAHKFKKLPSALPVKK